MTAFRYLYSAPNLRQIGDKTISSESAPTVVDLLSRPVVALLKLTDGVLRSVEFEELLARLELAPWLRLAEVQRIATLQSHHVILESATRPYVSQSIQHCVGIPGSG